MFSDESNSLFSQKLPITRINAKYHYNRHFITYILKLFFKKVLGKFNIKYLQVCQKFIVR